MPTARAVPGFEWRQVHRSVRRKPAFVSEFTALTPVFGLSKCVIITLAPGRYPVADQ